jgi:hypothetical protein
VNRQNGKWAPQEPEHRPENERRRIGRVVHDERGSASVEWRDAPADHVRQKLELEPSADSARDDSKLRRGFEPMKTLELTKDDTFNPYERKGNTFSGRLTAPPAPVAKGGKRDLKKLSEWVKLMRAMEDRKKNGDPDSEG